MKLLTTTILLSTLTATSVIAIDLSKTITTGHSVTTGGTITKVSGTVSVKELASIKTRVNGAIGGHCPTCGTNDVAKIEFKKDKLTTVKLDQTTISRVFGASVFCDTSLSTGGLSIGGKYSSSNNTTLSSTRLNNVTRVTGTELELAKFTSSTGKKLGSASKLTTFNQRIVETGNTNEATHTKTVTSGSYLN